MKTTNTKLFGSVHSPLSLSEILNFLENRSSGKSDVHIWRGQGDINWPIHSAAYRRLMTSRRTITESMMANYEEYLIESARHQGYGYIDGRKISDFELLARLQHHGAATRLIDFSRNMLVALWFACRSQPDSTGILFGIHTNYIGGDENTNEEGTYASIVKDKDFLSFNHPQNWQPPVVTKRIASQGASFLYSKISNSDMGSLAFEKEAGKYLSFALTPEFKKKMLILLKEIFDITQITMFPDIDGFSLAHSEQYRMYSNTRW